MQTTTHNSNPLHKFLNRTKVWCQRFFWQIVLGILWSLSIPQRESNWVLSIKLFCQPLAPSCKNFPTAIVWKTCNPLSRWRPLIADANYCHFHLPCTTAKLTLFALKQPLPLVSFYSYLSRKMHTSTEFVKEKKVKSKAWFPYKFIFIPKYWREGALGKCSSCL